MIGIITAMKEEAQLIIDKYNLKPLGNCYQNIKFFKNKNIVLVLSGIGKIQASCATTLLLEKFSKFDKIINIGIAGNTGKTTNSQVGDVFLIEKVYQHDIFMPFEGEHLDYFKKPILLPKVSFTKKFDFNIFSGICATGDQFVADKEKIQEIVNKTNADVVEMEAFAVASVCRELDFLDKLTIIKAVSDSADENALNDSENNLEIAMKNSIKVLDEIINS